MIQFNSIIFPKCRNNFLFGAKSKVNFRANDTYEKSFICFDNLCEQEQNICKENFPEDYSYKKDDNYFLKPHYVILHLESLKKGGGTMAIKNVVGKSLKNPLTQGRVILFSSTLDGEEYSAGFYYKLGFRFNYEKNNEIMEQWMKSGGKRETSPKIEGPMYLPKENIQACLNY